MFHKDPREAFANAIKTGYLTPHEECAPWFNGFGYAGNFMYMYSEIVRGPDYLINGSCRERDYFKDIDSRKYNAVPVWN